MNSLNLDIHHDSISTSITSEEITVYKVESMALPVMEFQDQEYEIRKKMHKNQHTQRKLLSIGLMGSLSSLHKIRLFKVALNIFRANLTFQVTLDLR